MFQKTRSSKHILVISFLLLISIAIGACASATTTETITDITWQWAELVETEPASQSLVPNPENYTLTLLSDGSLTLKADCNMASGSFTLDGSSLTIELGPSTMAFCGEQSLDVLYVTFLGNVASYTIKDGQLVLELKDNAGTMTFNKQ